MTYEKPLTAQDVAERLSIAKNTVYELVKRGDLSAYRVGRKMRFTKEDIQTYLDKSKTKENSLTETRSKNVASEEGRLKPNPSSNVMVISGQDVILDVLSNYLQRHPHGGPTLRSYVGSYNSLCSLYHGEIQVASAHLWDGDSGEYNLPFVRRLLPGIPAVIINLAYRMQGFYVAKGNPKGILTWQDLLRPGIGFINREKGAGSRVILDEHLRRLNVSSKEIRGYENESPSHLTVASSVARGDADVAIGTEKMAKQVEGIEFVPLQRERYDLVIKKDDLNKPQFQAILDILRSQAFQQEFKDIGGYDIKDMGLMVGET